MSIEIILECPNLAAEVSSKSQVLSDKKDLDSTLA